MIGTGWVERTLVAEEKEAGLERFVGLELPLKPLRGGVRRQEGLPPPPEPGGIGKVVPGKSMLRRCLIGRRLDDDHTDAMAPKSGIGRRCQRHPVRHDELMVFRRGLRQRAAWGARGRDFHEPGAGGISRRLRDGGCVPASSEQAR